MVRKLVESGRDEHNILLENKEHYEKLAQLVCSQEIAAIHQALDLAENMNYIGHVDYQQEDWANGYGILHTWNITGGYDPGFLIEIENQGSRTPRFFLDIEPTRDEMVWVLREKL